MSPKRRSGMREEHRGEQRGEVADVKPHLPRLSCLVAKAKHATAAHPMIAPASSPPTAGLTSVWLEINSTTLLYGEQSRPESILYLKFHPSAADALNMTQGERLCRPLRDWCRRPWMVLLEMMHRMQKHEDLLAVPPLRVIHIWNQTPARNCSIIYLAS